MRQIKFRAKDLEGHWICGYYTQGYIHVDNSWRDGDQGEWWGIPVDENTVGQFTGSYDNNEKDAYHKDIVKYGSNIGIIEWDNIAHSWCIYLMERDAYSQLIDGEYEIIGNIHDTPELLTK